MAIDPEDYLTKLATIHASEPDYIDGLVNVTKHQKTAGVVNDLRRYQSRSYSLELVVEIADFIQQSLNAQLKTEPVCVYTSLDRVARQREDEEMARKLYEAGFF